MELHAAPIELEAHAAVLASEFDEIAKHYDPPSQALTEMSRRIANRLEVDVCSIYVLAADHKNLCLAATMGLNQDSVGRVRMQTSEGLAGLVAEKLEPVSVAAAFEHPRFKYFPEAGEDRYSSFLGLPIIDSGLLQGVLVVQTIEAREFSETEFTLIAAAAELFSPHVTRCRLLEYTNPNRESKLG